MKSWNEAEMITLGLENTENGGTPSRDFDQQWFDQNGAIHVNFQPES